MPHHHARLIVVAIAAVSFSTPITAQQEPTPSPTLETLVETLGGRMSQNEQGEVVEVVLIGDQVTDASLAHLTGLPSLQSLDLEGTDVTAAGLVHFQKMPALRHLGLSGCFSSDRLTDADIANLREALPTGGGA